MRLIPTSIDNDDGISATIARKCCSSHTFSQRNPRALFLSNMECDVNIRKKLYAKIVLSNGRYMSRCLCEETKRSIIPSLVVTIAAQSRQFSLHAVLVCKATRSVGLQGSSAPVTQKYDSCHDLCALKQNQHRCMRQTLPLRRSFFFSANKITRMRRLHPQEFVRGRYILQDVLQTQRARSTGANMLRESAPRIAGLAGPTAIPNCHRLRQGVVGGGGRDCAANLQH